MNDFVKAFSFIGNNSGLLMDKVGEHMLVSVEAILIALVIGVPLGVWLGHLHRFSFLAINVANIGRALPSLAVLAILLPFTGIGRTDVIIALVVLAVPPILTNAYVAIDQVESDTVDAANGIGLRPMQVLFKIELPLALPLIFAGIRTSSVFVVATATLSGFFGGGGLGDIISNHESYGLSGIIGASYVLIVLAMLVQIAFLGVERAVTPASLRPARSRRFFRRAADIPRPSTTS
ncbi:MAG TPA: ABC transporter permease [Mycobacteriales bacterium]|nr:ABC transporter permease [Mycobacteriales bacterium]